MSSPVMSVKEIKGNNAAFLCTHPRKPGLSLNPESAQSMRCRKGPDFEARLDRQLQSEWHQKAGFVRGKVILQKTHKVHTSASHRL